MNSDIKRGGVKLPPKVKQFLNDFSSAAGLVFFIHLLLISLYAFALYDFSIVVMGFAFAEWSVVGRCLFLIPRS